MFKTRLLIEWRSPQKIDRSVSADVITKLGKIHYWFL